jgi:glycosyltransferase involved in cell wall biosynthesis
MLVIEPRRKKKIAFIRPAAIPLPNQVLPGILQKTFPEFDLDIIDVKEILKSHPALFAANTFAAITEYGAKLALRHITPREAFFANRSLYTKINKLVKEHVTTHEYAFTFQMQSLFDASTGLIPHFVYTDHTHLARLTYPNFDQHELRSQAWIDMEHGIYEHATINFTWSSNISKSIIEQYHIPANKVVFAGVGSNIDTQNLSLDNDNYHNKNILFVGIDWKRKGGPDLLNAFQEVLKKHPDAHLTIVGSVPEHNISNCETIGKISIDKVGKYFSKASIFCLPTTMEPFGVAFIEALYHKLPIVATNIGAIPDFVKSGENGYLVEPGDVQALAQSLDSLLCDPIMCKAFGQKGYARAIANYSWDKVAEKMSNAIRKTLNPQEQSNTELIYHPISEKFSNKL